MATKLILAHADGLKLSQLDKINHGCQQRQVEFLKGRWLIRNQVASFIGVAPEQIKFKRYGRRIRVVEPVVLELSLAHTKDWYACAISHVRVGVDVELVTRDVDILKIAARYFNKDEQDFISKQDQPEQSALQLWVKKEAYTKYLGSTLAKQLGVAPDINIDFREVAGCYLACASADSLLDFILVNL